VSEQNPTQKGKPPISITQRKIGEGEGESPVTTGAKEEVTEIPVIQARCPHCGRVLPGMNILTMELPTPQGGMVWLLPSCPFLEDKDGKAVDGGEPCGRVIGLSFAGYRAPQIATPGRAPGWPT
jgi:hypothetical protein